MYHGNILADRMEIIFCNMQKRGINVISGRKKGQGTDRDSMQDRCVLCGKFTGIKKNVPIKERKYYVETAGQLCEECYIAVYGQTHNDNILDM